MVYRVYTWCIGWFIGSSLRRLLPYIQPATSYYTVIHILAGYLSTPTTFLSSTTVNHIYSGCTNTSLSLPLLITTSLQRPPSLPLLIVPLHSVMQRSLPPSTVMTYYWNATNVSEIPSTVYTVPRPTRQVPQST